MELGVWGHSEHLTRGFGGWGSLIKCLDSKEHLDWLRFRCGQNNYCSRLNAQKNSVNGGTHIQC